MLGCVLKSDNCLQEECRVLCAVAELSAKLATSLLGQHFTQKIEPRMTITHI